MVSESGRDDGELFYDSLVQSYVRAPRFLRRDWLADCVDKAMAERDCRFVLLTGQPGAGKTAFMAQLAGDHAAWPRYFIRRDSQTPMQSGEARAFILAAGHQLAALHPELFLSGELEVSVRQQVDDLRAAGRVVGAEIQELIVSPFQQTARIAVEQGVRQVSGELVGLSVRRVVAEASMLGPNDLLALAVLAPARLLLAQAPEERIVILVDALDELRYQPTGESIVKWLAACPELPANMRLVLASRPETMLDAFKRRQEPWLACESIDPESDQVRADLRRYASAFVQEPQVQAALADLEQPAAALVGTWVDKADGNFQYLAALFKGIDQAPDEERRRRLLAAKEAPAGLDALYDFFLGLIRDDVADYEVEVPARTPGRLSGQPAWEGVYQPALGVLAVAHEPLSPAQIRHLAGIRAEDRWVQGALDRLGQFLDMSGICCRLYHASFAEFLTSPQTHEQYPRSYLDPGEWHRKIADSYQGEAASWAQVDWRQVDGYGVRNLPQHLAAAGLGERLRELLLDYGWLQAKIEGADVVSLIGDYDLARGDLVLRLAHDALRLSQYALVQDKAQLPGQLVGRLSSLEAPDLQALVRSARAWDGGAWLLPLTASLTRPGGLLVRLFRGRLGGHAGTPRSVALTPDGRWAISAGNSSNDRTVRVWDLDSGVCRYVFEDQATAGGYTPLALAASGSLAVSSYQDEVRAWDLETGGQCAALAGNGEVVTALSLAADGRRAMAGTEGGSVRVWDVAAQAGVDLPGHGESVRAVAISTDGRWAASASASGVKVWDVEAGKERGSIEVPTGLGGPQGWTDAQLLWLSDDGLQVWLGSDPRHWDVAAGAITELQAPPGAILAFTPGGQRAVAPDGSVWDLSQHRQLITLPQPRGISTLAITPNGARVITADFDHDLRVWDLSDEALRLEQTPAAEDLRFEEFAVRGNSAVLRTAEGRRELRSLERSGLVMAPGAHDDLLREASARDRRRAATRERVAKKLKLAREYGSELLAVADDGRRAVSAYGPRGKLGDYEEPDQPAAPDADGEVTLWDLRGEPVATPLRGHSRPMLALDMTPDGRWAISGGWGRVVRVWDLDAAAERWVLRGHTGLVTGVAISADGHRGASSSEDGTVRVWDLTSGRPIATFSGEAWMDGCSISAQGEAVVATESTGPGTTKAHILRLCGV